MNDNTTELQRGYCNVCLSLDSVALRLDRYRHGREFTLAEWDLSSSSGCVSCKVVVEAIKYYFPKMEGLELITLVNSEKFKSLMIAFRLQPSELNIPSDRWIQLSLCPGQTSPWSDLEIAQPISGGTGSQQAVFRVRKWLDQCIRQHGMCKNTTSSVLPTRVIKISGPEHIRLHIPNAQEAQYVCLSHCWGGGPVMKTTKQNLSEFQSRIPWHELSRTFREAIDFAYRLGFFYIWIDSLCIIQDSAEDWRHEGGKMDSIYANTSLTLAAAKSADSTQGCFGTSRSIHESRTWRVSMLDSPSFEVHSRIRLEHTDFYWGTMPLMQRGWTYQERLLSPRTLHFTNDELILECLSGITCECSDDVEIPCALDRPQNWWPKYWAQSPIKEADIRWRYIIESYTRLTLSFESDIFPALQGLAKMMPCDMGLYLAGLWSHTLPHNLTWHVRPEKTRARRFRPIEWRAPTWSWASTTGSIGWMRYMWFHQMREYDTPELFITVVNAMCSPIAEDATGQINSGELILRGHCLSGMIHYPASGQHCTVDPYLEISCPGKLLSVSSQENITIVWSDTTRPGDLLSSATGHLLTDFFSTANSSPLARPLSKFDFMSNRRNPVLSKGKGKRMLEWDYSIEMEGPHQVRSGSEILILKVEGFITHGECELAWIVLRSVDEEAGTFERLGLLYTRDSLQDAELWKASNISPEVEIKII
ncbi:hypothetical protein HBH56_043950 [Parastagonospora nodorum]|uniref:Heterokaryon incompatibility domain-containing protein n=2 Tax=Phaeosphaeria nodorum (strain SN15 / ATCC MYA-4574 / FGSC 10173) TaxID=321614 RepID=A0A7U2HUY2_PHANO|nr:hypothetical protein SNOG_08138 [Parastagonospora nodorum SN15]KAH3917716.1 hypothetical protein HBH56_043950 [Parastagonospora nodorum]EAT84414.1 hypothetical protein SNOG_08138 [Parastagonospora nodorum SN15]KAH3933374.1 hypothetical protein HBH54_071700 [Parastagonospora nodorum]KAH3972925.1 hypothetical protein HBH52_143780 [Parastagonospora nodorum]KAH4004036.1 hypothetical protein HBI10_050710 [Parastagonospora nodorum]